MTLIVDTTRYFKIRSEKETYATINTFLKNGFWVGFRSSTALVHHCNLSIRLFLVGTLFMSARKLHDGIAPVMISVSFGLLLLGSLLTSGISGFSGPFSGPVAEWFLSPLQVAAVVHPADGAQQKLGELHYALGSQLALHGQTLAAEPLLLKATQLLPTNPMVFLLYAHVQDALDQDRNAVEAYERSIRIKPDLVAAHYSLGLLYDREGRLPDAIASLKKAVTLEPNNAYLNYDLGVLFAKQNNYQQSAIYSRQAMETSQGFAESFNNYAFALANLKQYEKALPVINTSLKIKPNNPAALDTKGFIFFGLQRYAEAATFYQKAIDADPTIGEIYLHLGEALEKLNHRAEALRAYETCLTLLPKQSQRNEIESRIQRLRYERILSQKTE
jgi:tetratricopeptide (TPR) repeat protein